MDTWGFMIGLSIGILVTGLTAVGLFIKWLHDITKGF